MKISSFSIYRYNPWEIKRKLSLQLAKTGLQAIDFESTIDLPQALRYDKLSNEHTLFNVGVKFILSMNMNGLLLL